MDLGGKNVVITGASSGIGHALLSRLLKEGANVFAVSRSIEDKLTFSHRRLTIKNIDVSTETGVDALFEEALRMFERIDLFIANAGFAYHELLDNADWRHIEDIMKTNAQSVIYSAVKMRELYTDDPFRFMATLSAMSFLPLPGYALYSSTKAALKGFFDAYEHELLRSDQLLQRVYPVATRTAFFDKVDQPRQPKPVQPAEHVAEVMIKGIKKDKREIFPSRLFKWTYRLAPWLYKWYLSRERRLFFQDLTENVEL